MALGSLGEHEIAAPSLHGSDGFVKDSLFRSLGPAMAGSVQRNGASMGQLDA